MSKDKNYHVIEATYIGAGNFKGARMKLYDARFSKTRYVSYDYAARDILEQANNWLTENKFDIVGHAEGKKGFYIITDTFKSI